MLPRNRFGVCLHVKCLLVDGKVSLITGKHSYDFISLKCLRKMRSYHTLLRHPHNYYTRYGYPQLFGWNRYLYLRASETWECRTMAAYSALAAIDSPNCRCSVAEECQRFLRLLLQQCRRRNISSFSRSALRGISSTECYRLCDPFMGWNCTHCQFS